MSDEIDDGGPAFPKTDDRDPTTGEGIMRQSDGMSLRDWFAGQALAGMLAGENCTGEIANDASTAYRYADAMLRARKP